MGKRKGKKTQQRQKAYKQYSHTYNRTNSWSKPTVKYTGNKPGRLAKKGPKLIQEIATEVFGGLYFCVGDEIK